MWDNPTVSASFSQVMKMKIYVGVTDNDWFRYLRENKCDELNFWLPGKRTFKALSENDMFLFKLHAPYNYIVGGGYFVRYARLPVSLAWHTFGKENGVASLQELVDKISKYRQERNINIETTEIGCVILTEPFYFDDRDWIPIPNWSPSIVTGKTFNTQEEDGLRIYNEVQERLSTVSGKENYSLVSRANAYSIGVQKHRLGQGAFRAGVVDAYGRRCAITGEKTLPVLEAAHIKPYSEEGPHEIDNGILLKSDLHILFDEGYITIDENYQVDISKRLHEDFGNGKRYYEYQGRKLMILPSRVADRPNKEFIEWHNDHVFLG